MGRDSPRAGPQWRIGTVKQGAERLLKKLTASQLQRVIQDLQRDPLPERLRPNQKDHLKGVRRCTYEYRDLPFPYQGSRLLYVVDKQNKIIDLVDAGPHDILNRRT